MTLRSIRFPSKELQYFAAIHLCSPFMISSYLDTNIASKDGEYPTRCGLFLNQGRQYKCGLQVFRTRKPFLPWGVVMPRIIQSLLFLFLVVHVSASHALTLNWAGCGITKKAFMAELAEAYEKKTGIAISLEGGGATKGIRRIVSGEVDIGGSCRFHIPEDDISRGVIRFNPVAWDALTVVVHKSNPVESITLDQLRDVYTGKVSNWTQIGGQDQPLELLIRDGKISGVGHTLRKFLFGDENMEFKGAQTYKSSGPLEKAVEENPNAIAVTGISSARKRDFKILKLDGKEPNYENIKQGKYLLYRPLYIVTNRHNQNYAEVEKFLSFAHSRVGREIMRKNGVVPYLEAVWLSQKLRNQWENEKELRRQR